MELRDRSVIVTGASSGIGWETALAFAERGARVMAVARREERLRELVEACRAHAPGCDYLAGDLGQRSFAERCVSETARRFGGLDVLVNNAAMPKRRPVYATTVEEVEQVMRLNFMACVWTCLAAIPLLARRGGGAIVNVSSFASEVVPPREAFYAASKGALSSFTRGLGVDLADSKIHALLVLPGPIETEIWEHPDEPPSPYRGRLYPARQVADAILEALAKRRLEIVVPRRNPALTLARWFRLLAPGLVRAGTLRLERVPPHPELPGAGDEPPQA